MDSQLSSVLQQLPAAGDVFESVQLFLTDQVYPDLGRAFWIQAYVALSLLCIAGVLFVITLVIKAKKGKLTFIVNDGSCSRLDLKTAIPFLWILGIALQIAFTWSFRQCLANRSYTHFMGAMWYLVYSAPSVTYALLSASVVASAPPMRRFLSHLPYGVVWYNGTVMLVACAIITGVIVPALAHARAMQGIGAAYNTISEAIQEARSRQDMSALLAVMNLLPLLDAADSKYRSATRVASGTCSAFLAFYLFTGAVPATVLGRLVYQKITRLQNSNNSSADSYNLSASRVECFDLAPHLHIDIEPNASVEKIAKYPDQPKDRPFAQLIAMPTTDFPARFHAVMQAEDQTAQQRADNLRAIVRTDLKVFILFFLAVTTFLAGCLFLACGGLNRLSISGELIFGYTYFSWNFTITASGLAALLCWDAFHLSGASMSSESRVGRKQNLTTSTQFGVDSGSAIQCNQIVAVSYAQDCEPDSPSCEKKATGTRKSEMF